MLAKTLRYLLYLDVIVKNVIAKLFLLFAINFPALATDKPLSEAVKTLNLVSIDGPISSISINGTEVKVDISAWSNTLGNAQYVESAHLGTYNNSLTVTNRAGHGDNHYIDNGRYFDMVLFSFEQAVTLKGASFLKIESSKPANGINDVTVAGLSDDVFNLFNSGKNTWSDIAGKAILNASGHFGIKHKQSTFEGLTSAKYWLVGAYNSVFSNKNNLRNTIGFKLTSLNIELKSAPVEKPSSKVYEPSALALMSLGLGLVLYRRKRRV